MSKIFLTSVMCFCASVLCTWGGWGGEFVLMLSVPLCMTRIKVYVCTYFHVWTQCSHTYICHIKNLKNQNKYICIHAYIQTFSHQAQQESGLTKSASNFSAPPLSGPRHCVPLKYLRAGKRDTFLTTAERPAALRTSEISACRQKRHIFDHR